MLKKDGTVWGTGVNTFGQLGIDMNNNTMQTTFVQAVFMHGIAKAVAAGSEHSLVLTQNGNVYSAGSNVDGQLGDGSNIDSDSFVQVMISSFLKIIAISAGGKHSMVMLRGGSVWVTGCNSHGQLGDGSLTSTSTFVRVIKDRAKAVAAGSRHSMVLTRDGAVWLTGSNEYGQLGIETVTYHTTFTKVIENKAKAIAAGSFHNMVLKTDGSVWATGSNEYGQLGEGSVEPRTTFVKVISSGAKAITAGGDHSMVLKKYGSVWAAGA